ncbi:MAG: TatD family hydrolase [Clostridia bacterium]|nr:TatD family hydrolase [Clostridia bacterium]
MLFDSHAHFDDRQFDADREEVLKSLKAFGVCNIVNVGADIEGSKASVALADKYDFIYATVGVHPSDTGNMTDRDIDTLRELAKHKKVVAIGEIGLDYHYMDGTDPQTQKKWFIRQIDLAKELDMPIVVHDRESKGDSLKILKENKVSKGVVHCYSGSAETAREIIGLGMMISFTGVLTFKNARRAVEACREIPIERIMIETDCPYMAPEPHRGKRNFSGYVEFVARKIGEIKGMTFEKVAEITTANAKKFYGIE